MLLQTDMAYMKRKMNGENMSKNTAITIKDQSMDIMKLGEVLTQSGYFQDARQAAQAIVKVLAGQEIGLGPIASMTGIYIIKGRVTLSANAMAAVIKNSGKYDYRIIELDNEHCKIEFHQGDEKVGLSEFTLEDAKLAGLIKDTWQKFPRNMLFARALSNGAKWFCADVFAGGSIYTPDELGADIDGETGEVIEGQIVNDELKWKAIALEAEGISRKQILEELQKEDKNLKPGDINNFLR